MRRRSGISTIEIVIAGAILAAGMAPLFGGLGQSRTAMAMSRDLTLLENDVYGALGEARVRILTRGLVDGEPVLVRERDGRRTEVSASRVGARDLIILHARGESAGRFFELDQVVADPHVATAEPRAG